MAKRDKYVVRGCYYGIKDGKVKRITEHLDGQTIVLRDFFEGGNHAIMFGRPVKSEVRVVFGLSDVEYVSEFNLGIHYEKRVREKLEELIRSRKEPTPP